MRSHTQEKLVACPTCGSMFSSNTKLFDHLHRQAEPNGKKGKLVFCSQQVLFIYLKIKVWHLLIFSTQSLLYANIVEKLFPTRGSWEITFASTVMLLPLKSLID